jgi:hypothetical protein
MCSIDDLNEISRWVGDTSVEYIAKNNNGETTVNNNQVNLKVRFEVFFLNPGAFFFR